MAPRAAPAALAPALLPALALALALPGAAAAGPGGRVLVVESDGGAALARLPLGADGGFCLDWRHSVTGGPVADCFAAGPDGGGLVLAESFLHDYAAGLGDIPGRGRVEAAPGGGYRILDIGEPLPGGVLRLRVGPARVGHRLTSAAATLDLSALAPGRRVTLRLAAVAP